MKCLMNNIVRKSIEEELNKDISVDMWDMRKGKIQAVIRQYKLLSAPEKKICKLREKIVELQKQVMQYPEREELNAVIETPSGPARGTYNSCREMADSVKCSMD